MTFTIFLSKLFLFSYEYWQDTIILFISLNLFFKFFFLFITILLVSETVTEQPDYGKRRRAGVILVGR